MTNDRNRADSSDRAAFGDLPARSGSRFVRLGEGEIGGKARGLAEIDRNLAERLDRAEFPAFRVGIPRFRVIASDWFDEFMERNRLHDIAVSDTRDGHMMTAFQKAELPEGLVRELSGLAVDAPVPLAVRSSSLLEDSLREPFAGVYATKMVPNNQFSAEARMRALVEAIKFVYASTYSSEAKSYRQALGRSHDEEKMAIMVQEIVGLRHGDRFYPSVSGVARSHNFYALGHSRPENGVVSLALGLGKTIVDGGRCWTYCPVFPKAQPPFASTKELLAQTQTRLWAVNMGKPPTYDPALEAEYLLEADLRQAEEDDVLGQVASTYDPQSDRVTLGTGRPGPRVLDFAPLLQLDEFPLNDLVRRLLATCEDALGDPVEIEFAANFEPRGRQPARFGFLQVRPMLVSTEGVEVREEELRGERVLVASEQVLGNGQVDDIRDVVHVRRDAFSAKETWLIAAELEEMNRRLLDAGRPYLLVAIGRLGTSDPWLGIPVRWGQVSGARAIVEASTPGMNVDMSQGSHFFHNVTCLRVLYFSVGRSAEQTLRWDWLESRQAARETRFVRHVALDQPLRIKVDGKSSRGVICHERADPVSD